MHDLAWDDLRYALAAARAGSFTRAAADLGVQQSTVSRRIAALEAALGGDLFLRSRGGLAPTARGAALLERARAAEAAVRAALEGAREDEVAGEVRLTLAPGLASLWLAPRLPELLDAHPRLRLELVVTLAVADLSRHEADLAVRFAPPDGGELVSRRLGALEHAILAHRRWADTTRERLPWVQVTVPGFDAPEAAWTRQHGGTIAVHTSDYPTAIAAVRAGAGAMVVSAALADGDVVALPPWAPLPPPAPLWLVAHRATRRSARVDAVWRALAAWAEMDLARRP